MLRIVHRKFNFILPKTETYLNTVLSGFQSEDARFAGITLSKVFHTT